MLERVRQIEVSHAMFKVTSFVDFGPHLKSFDVAEQYIYHLRDQQTVVVTIPRHTFMEDDFSIVKC